MVTSLPFCKLFCRAASGNRLRCFRRPFATRIRRARSINLALDRGTRDARAHVGPSGTRRDLSSSSFSLPATNNSNLLFFVYRLTLFCSLCKARRYRQLSRRQTPSRTRESNAECARDRASLLGTSISGSSTADYDRRSRLYTRLPLSSNLTGSLVAGHETGFFKADRWTEVHSSSAATGSQRRKLSSDSHEIHRK